MTPGTHPFLLAEAAGSGGALLTFVVYTILVFVLAAISNRLLQSKSFLGEYFLGSRSLGMWAFALTFAATSSSGGSFTGFPSKIYSHGWILALWIGSYMVVPICTMGLFGKRLNQVARISGAITVPDVLRDRFRSPSFGLMATALIVFFMSFNLVAQFKAGSLILRTLLSDVELFQSGSLALGQSIEGIALFEGVDAAYLLCLLSFGVAVIIYTTYGGFHAVVWTDVMQGIVMVAGVIIMLPLTLSQVGGLESATRELEKMTPPYFGEATVQRASASDELTTVAEGTWFTLAVEGSDRPRLFRTSRSTQIKAGETSSDRVEILEISTPEEIDRITAEGADFEIESELAIVDPQTERQAYPTSEDQRGAYVRAPGPSTESTSGFLPISLAISFFFMWAISGSGQPSNMVRLMAFNNNRTLRRAIFTVAIYYTLIYFPLVIIFCCARVLLPGMDAESDRIMPAMAVFVTENVGLGWLAGLLVAAPFAAVMSTVDSFLLMISSALVRDLYQRNLNPEATEKQIKRLSYLCTLLVGTGAMLGAINPPQFLQDIIVYTGSGLAASFLAPIVFSLYWPRMNVQGAIGGMLCGFAAHFSLYTMGIWLNGSFFKPFRPFEFDPIVIGLFVSFTFTYLICRATRPPEDDLVRKYFYRPKA